MASRTDGPSPELSLNLQFLPYIRNGGKQHDQGDLFSDHLLSVNVSQSARLDALKFNIQDMSSLLGLPFDVFWSVILFPRFQDQSFVVFLDQYLKVHLELATWSRPLFWGETSDAANLPGFDKLALDNAELQLEHDLAHKLFQVICRMAFDLERLKPIRSSVHEGGWSFQLDSETNSKQSTRNPPNAVFTLPRLMDICRVFAHSNLDVLQRVINEVLTYCPWLLDQVTSASDFVEDVVHTARRKLEKLISRRQAGCAQQTSSVEGKGKGKGKGKVTADVEQQGSNSSDSADQRSDAASIPVELATELDFLIDAILSLEALVFAGRTMVADVLVSKTSFITSLINCYEAANIADSLLSGTTPTSSVDSISRALPLPHQLKLAILALLEGLIANAFLVPLGVPGLDTTAMYQKTVLIPQDTVNIPEDIDQCHIGGTSRKDALCDLVIRLLESSQFDGPVHYLKDAPILIDLEVEWGLGELLRLLRGNKAGEHDDGDPRIEYLILSLEQMLTFSGNAEARRMVVNRKLQVWGQQQAEMLAATQASGESILLSQSSEAAAFNEDYIKRTSLISQVQDLFPDLGEGFIEACLVALNDDCEAVTMKILEEDLPDVVKKLDRKMARTVPVQHVTPTVVPVPPEYDTPAPLRPNLTETRRNVFDNDEMDVFRRPTVDRSKIIFGKKEKTAEVLKDRSFMQTEKQAILNSYYNKPDSDEEDEDSLTYPTSVRQDEEAIYDDEYDDTYDSTDIKLAGTVEMKMLDESESVVNRPADRVSDNVEDPSAAFEAELVRIVESGQAALLEASARKSPARGALKRKTGLSDEQLEGWYKMFLRDPRRQKKLQEKYEFRGNKAPPPVTDLGRKSGGSSQPAQKNAEEESSEEEQGVGSQPKVYSRGPPRGGFAASNRGGSGRGGRGGQKKYANHARKDGRQKKVAKSMAGTE
ncbi:hypothetical protein HDV05_004948 [Chytridiales sp. JEL 0842]|nr:hypothetical protein HDV05_004948 [Chytridiales sp. JEL 0842]